MHRRRAWRLPRVSVAACCVAARYNVAGHVTRRRGCACGVCARERWRGKHGGRAAQSCGGGWRGPTHEHNMPAHIVVWLGSGPKCSGDPNTALRLGSSQGSRAVCGCGDTHVCGCAVLPHGWGVRLRAVCGRLPRMCNAHTTNPRSTHIARTECAPTPDQTHARHKTPHAHPHIHTELLQHAYT